MARAAFEEPALHAEGRIGFVDPAGCVPYPALGNSGRLEARSQKMEEGLSGRRLWGAAAVYDEHLKL